MGNKGARVVTNLTIPGRYLVLMPTVDYMEFHGGSRMKKAGKMLAAGLKPKGWD